MIILQQLEDLKEKLRRADGMLSDQSLVCANAASIIHTQVTTIKVLEKQIDARFDELFAAAMSGLLASGYDGDVINKAERLARVAMVVKP